MLNGYIIECVFNLLKTMLLLDTCISFCRIIKAQILNY